MVVSDSQEMCALKKPVKCDFLRAFTQPKTKKYENVRRLIIA